MNERSTDSGELEKREEIYPEAEASDTQGMGDKRQWDGRSQAASDSSPYPLSMEKGLRARGGDIFEWEAVQDRSSDKGIGRREPEAERGTCHADPGIDVVKKKDELGLANRQKGSPYSALQRQRIVEEVEKMKASGIKKAVALRELGICRSTYYGWIGPKKVTGNRVSVLKLTEAERRAVIEKKKGHPYLSHRQISGYLRHEGYWVSESSCYRVLKALDWVLPQVLREAPWKDPHYEPFTPNQIWGEDWTRLSICGKRHYLLTIIDYFSRYVVAWAIVKTVTQREVKDLLAIAYMDQGIAEKALKPLIHLDQGSPNMAYGTRRLIRDLEMVFSPSRVSRPTDNGRQERWYRTVKQEEIYCYPAYPSIEAARRSMARYIEDYNEERPHQALWNYPPGYVHRLGNKSEVLQRHREIIQAVKKRRLDENRALLAMG